MTTLKKMIRKYMSKITMMVSALILLCVLLIQLSNEQNRARDTAASMFQQMEQVLTENQADLKRVKNDYTETCLHNAEVVASIIQERPSVLNDMVNLREIAKIVEVDEIHIFNEKGCIYTGTHPEYYGLTVYDGEQIGFFKPLLSDKSLRLCQDIAPNTAEGKKIQYAALWSDNGKFIVQVGMEQDSVKRATEKNELSYIFSLLRVNVGAEFYALDATTGKVVGSSVTNDVGKTTQEAGIDFEKVKKDADGFHARVNGKICFCIFSEVEGNYIGYVVTTEELYQRTPSTILIFMLALALTAIILVAAVTRHMNRYVVKGINTINESLRVITEGDLDASVDVQTSAEFSELSNYINEMVKSLLANTKKISYVLNKGNMYIGVYEYNLKAKKVRFTEYIPKILHMEEEMLEKLSSDYGLFQEYMNKLRQNRVVDEENIYRLEGNEDVFIKLDEVIQNNEIFGVMMDVTEEIAKRREIEEERDRDLLTGLYNRRGIERNLEALLKHQAKLGLGALVMIDADGLKGINDTYGHEKGDIYLKKIASIINGYGLSGTVCGRLGGDEFVLFLYDCDSEEELASVIKTLEHIRETTMVRLLDGVIVPLRFSYGYSTLEEADGYEALLKLADERMYENKRNRKSTVR